MAGIAVAEGPRRKREPKVLQKMTIEPRLGGGHIITHHYTSYQHEPEPHEFEAREGGKALAHIKKHAGLEEQGASEPEPFE